MTGNQVEEGQGLTRAHLTNFTQTTRRQEAHRRGRPSPSPEPTHQSLLLPRVSSDILRRAYNEPNSSRFDNVLHSHGAFLAVESNIGVAFGADSSQNRIVGLEVAQNAGASAKHGSCPPSPNNMVADNKITNGASMNYAQDLENSTAPTNGHLPLAVQGMFADDSPFKGLLPVSMRPPDEFLDTFKAASGHRPNPAIINLKANEPENGQLKQTHILPAPPHPDPHFPPDFPRYHRTQNMNEIAAYLANAGYVISLGGPPLASLKYGIIVVPVGEERLLFGGKAPSETFNQDFLDAIEDAWDTYEKGPISQLSQDPRSPGQHRRQQGGLHAIDSDSDDFVRHRFDDDFPAHSLQDLRNFETKPSKNEAGFGIKASGSRDDAIKPPIPEAIQIEQTAQAELTETAAAWTTKSIKTRKRLSAKKAGQARANCNQKVTSTKTSTSMSLGIIKTQKRPRTKLPVAESA